MMQPPPTGKGDLGITQILPQLVQKRAKVDDVGVSDENRLAPVLPDPLSDHPILLLVVPVEAGVPRDFGKFSHWD